MKKAISVKRKKIGRPATGTEPLYGVRIGDGLMKQIMDWAKAQEFTRSEAIRRLVELGLSKSARPTRPSIKYEQRTRAAALAAKAIDKHIDPDASPEERDVRKRKLLEGPSIIRDHRKDRPR